MGDISGFLLTVYDKNDEPQVITDKTVMDGLSIQPMRFPRHWYRCLRYGNTVVFTSELNPPEIGVDSAMEMGLDN